MLANSNNRWCIPQVVYECNDLDETLLLVHKIVDSVVLYLAFSNLFAYCLADINVNTKQQRIVGNKSEFVLVGIE